MLFGDKSLPSPLAVSRITGRGSRLRSCGSRAEYVGSRSTLCSRGTWRPHLPESKNRIPL